MTWRRDGYKAFFINFVGFSDMNNFFIDATNVKRYF